jgi:hypothetical protein
VIRGLEKEPRKRKDAARRQVLLDERIEFGIEGFKRGGVLLTRRDILEMFSKAPESAGELYPLTLDELIRTEKPPLIEPYLAFHSVAISWRAREESGRKGNPTDT